MRLFVPAVVALAAACSSQAPAPNPPARPAPMVPAEPALAERQQQPQPPELAPYRRLRGTGVYLRAPAFLVPGHRHASLQNSDRPAAIVGRILWSSFDDSVSSLSSATDLNLAEGELMTVDGRRAYLARARGAGDQTVAAGWYLVLEGETALLALLAFSAVASDSEALRASLLSVRWRPSPSIPVGERSWTITPPAGFAAGQINGDLVSFDPSGAQASIDPHEPRFAVAPLGAPPLDDLDRELRRQLTNARIAEGRLTSVELQTPVIDGALAARELTAIDSTGEQPRFVFLCVISYGADAYLVVGSGPAERQAELVPSYRAALETFRRSPAEPPPPPRD